jgi:wyosine [tRNA(Phe)-imidazoG37] synthetase (radical SAM superfamily)
MLMIVWWVKHWSYNISWHKVFELTGAIVVCLQQCTVYQRGLAGDTDDKQ